MAKKLVADQMVLSANRLADGRVIYLGIGGWTLDFAEARVIRGPGEAEAAEAKGAEAVAGRLLVEPYLIAVEEAEDGFVPSRLRERIRHLGPTTGNSRTAA